MPRLAAWNMDESSGDVLDVVGNRDFALNNGMQRVATTVEPERPNHPAGGALTKVGPTSLALVSNNMAGLQTTSRSFGLWVKGIGNQVWCFRFYDSVDDTGTWGLYFLGGLAIMRMRRGNANTNASASFSDDGKWHHWFGTFDGTTGRLFKDGSLFASAAPGGPLDTDASAVEVLETSLTTQQIDDLQLWDEAFVSGPESGFMLPVAADEGATAELVASIPLPTMTGEAIATATADLASTIPMPLFAGEAAVTAEAEMSAVVPMPTFAGQIDGQLPAEATLDAEIPLPFGGTGVTLAVSIELRTQRALTKAFIDSSPILITLTPVEQEKKPSGGVAMVRQAPREPQTFRLIPQNHLSPPRQSSSASAAADSGIQRRYDYVLLGEWDSEMQEEDTWITADGQHLVIEYLVSDNGYERKGFVFSYGRRPKHA